METKEAYTQLVVQVKSHGVSNEILGSWLEAKLFVDSLHAVPIEIDTYAALVLPRHRSGMVATLMGRRVLVLPVLQELKELLCAALFKDPHKRTPDGLHLSAGNLRDPAVAVDEAAGDLLELEITSDIGVDEDLGQFSRGDDELGHEVDGVVTVASKVCWGFDTGPEFAVELANVSGATRHVTAWALTWVRLRLALSAP